MHCEKKEGRCPNPLSIPVRYLYFLGRLDTTDDVEKRKKRKIRRLS